MVLVNGAGKLVGARAGHGVDAGTGKRALAHVVGRNAHLNLLDGVERNWLGIGLPADRGVEPEGVVEDGPSMVTLL